MRTDSAFTDELLLAQLQAPPDLSDGAQSLAYWQERRRRLSWFRLRARREAQQMTARWEQRVGSALISQRGVPITIRVSAGLLLARTRLWRWRRAAIVMSTAVAVTLIAVPVLAMIVAVRAI